MKSTLTPQHINFKTTDFKIYIQPNTQSSLTGLAFHEAIEIKYIYEDNVALMINSNIIIANTGDITVVNPYEIHANIDFDKYNGKYHMIIIDIDALSNFNHSEYDLRHILIEKRLKFNNHIKDNKSLQQIFKKIIDESINRKKYHKTIIQSLMCEFFAILLREELNENCDNGSNEVNEKYKKSISPALTKIHAHYTKKLTTKELAKECNLSMYHFCRIFKLAMNMTSVEYIIQHRINIAETLLKATKDTITEIAWGCGFESESYFSRCYKKLKGVSPKTYRKNN